MHKCAYFLISLRLSPQVFFYTENLNKPNEQPDSSKAGQQRSTAYVPHGCGFLNREAKTMHSIQSIFDQQQDNSIRLANYRAQLTAEQRIRAEVADKVKRYCTQFDLSIKQSLSAIGIALNLIDVGCTADQAYKTGANAARILALVSTGQKLSSITRRKINILH